MESSDEFVCREESRWICICDWYGVQIARLPTCLIALYSSTIPILIPPDCLAATDQVLRSPANAMKIKTPPQSDHSPAASLPCFISPTRDDNSSFGLTPGPSSRGRAVQWFRHSTPIRCFAAGTYRAGKGESETSSRVEAI